MHLVINARRAIVGHGLSYRQASTSEVTSWPIPIKPGVHLSISQGCTGVHPLDIAIISVNAMRDDPCMLATPFNHLDLVTEK